MEKKEQIRSKDLKEFIKEIQYYNRNPRCLNALKLLEDYSTNPERNIHEKTTLYRCRIINDEKDINKEDGFYGFDINGSFVPPVESTKDMRANYRYIPYLYCANNPYTALVEVRPRIGARVSVATIQVNQPLRLLDFTLYKIICKMTEEKVNLFSDLSMLYSKPIANDDDLLDYIPTQFIAEYVKNLNYDGIAFKSSLTPENEIDIKTSSMGIDLDMYNLVVFSFGKCKPIKSNVVQIKHSYTECQQVDDSPIKIEISSLIDKQLEEILA